MEAAALAHSNAASADAQPSSVGDVSGDDEDADDVSGWGRPTTCPHGGDQCRYRGIVFMFVEYTTFNLEN